jgi:hypothetical protein
MRHQLNLTNYQGQLQFGWTGPIAIHEGFHRFPDDFDPWRDDDELPTYEEVANDPLMQRRVK